jgi:hypothetical protein
MMVTGIGQIVTGKREVRTGRADQDRQVLGRATGLGLAAVCLLRGADFD